MPWDSKVYRRVTEEIRDRRFKAIDEAKIRRIHSQELIPELAGINKALDDLGFMIFGAGINGGDVAAKIDNIKLQTDALRERKRELLIGAGLSLDYDEEKWVCPECQDLGHVGMDMCRCKREMLALASIEASGLGKVMREQSFDNFSLDYYPEELREQISGYRDTLRIWSENFTGKGNYILTGGTGLGKTHLSTSAAKAAIHRGYNVIYITADEFFGAFQQQRFGGGHAGDGTTERFSDCDLLIIDDLGTECTNKFTVSCLYNVVNARINNDRATLISTNLTGQELRERYEERTGSRIFGNYIPLIFSGKDIRRQRLTDAH